MTNFLQKLIQKLGKLHNSPKTFPFMSVFPENADYLIRRLIS